MPSLHTNIFITFVLRLFLLLFVAPLVAFSSHTDKLRLEFRQDIHQISLAVDHLIDVFIDFRRFVQGSSDQRDALFLFFISACFKVLKAAARLITLPAP